MTTYPSAPSATHRDFSRIARKGLWICVVLVGGFLTWACLAPISSAVVAPGVIKIWSNRKTIQHLDGGMVRAIYVADGSMVQSGDPLILLEDTTTSAALNILLDQRDALAIQEQRFLVERDQAGRFVLPEALIKRNDPKITALYHSELALFESRRKSLDDQIKLLREGIAQARSAANSTRDEISAIQDGIGYTQDLVKMTEAMAKQGFVERTLLLQKREALAEKRERLHSQMAKLADIQKQIADQELRVIALRNTYTEEAETGRKKTRDQISEIEERLRPARNANERSLLTAPISGQVMALKVTTIGGVIRPGDPLLDIVPQNKDLVVEVKVHTQDVDNVHLGQIAEIQLNAYNQRNTPLIAGRVSYVSGDALDDPRMAGVSYFLSHIRLDQAQLDRLTEIAPSPGMPVTAFIKIKARTFMDYLLSPLTDHWRRTFREE